MATQPMVEFFDLHNSYRPAPNLFYATGMIGATGLPSLGKGGYNEKKYELRFPSNIENPPHLFTISIACIKPWGGSFNEFDIAVADICQIGDRIPDMDISNASEPHGVVTWDADYFEKTTDPKTGTVYITPGRRTNTFQPAGGYQGDGQNLGPKGDPNNMCTCCWIGIPGGKAIEATLDDGRSILYKPVTFRVRSFGCGNDVVAVYNVMPCHYTIDR